MKKVCIVDDYDINLFVLEEYLKDNYIVLTFNNAKDCIEYLKKNNTDLVLMDTNMPIMNGHDASKLLKKEHPELKIIAVTAHVSENDQNIFTQNNIEDVIVKPVFKDILVEKINLLI